MVLYDRRKLKSVARAAQRMARHCNCALSDELCSFLRTTGTTQGVFQFCVFHGNCGSLAGAFAGARAAQSIAEKPETRTNYLEKFASQTLRQWLPLEYATLLSAKKQHIKSLKTQFDQQRASTREAIARQQNDRAARSTLTRTSVHFSIRGRPIALITTLIQSVDGLNLAIKKRNQLVGFYKASSLPPNRSLALYLAFHSTSTVIFMNILT